MLPWPFLLIFVWRTLFVWLSLHALVLGVAGSLLFSYHALLLALVATLAILLIDLERRRERRFLANVGVSRFAVGAVIVSSALALEGALKLLADSWAL